MNQLAVPVTEDTKPARTAPGWLVLSIDSVRLAVSQKDVKTIELASRLDVAVDDEMEAGWLEQDGKMWPVYSVDANLALQVRTPHPRRFCVMLYAGEKLIGFLCDEVRMLPSDGDLDLQMMPECLADPHSALQRVALLDGEIVIAAGNGALARYLTELEAADDTG